MTMLADRVDFVIGVDTHKFRHAAAALNRTGGAVSDLEVEASSSGYRQLLAWAAVEAEGCRAWAIEGTGSYGAGLASFLRSHGEWVLEIDRPGRSPRRRGKSDPLDAIRAGREALSLDLKRIGEPRQRGPREAMRVLLSSRAAVVKTRTRTLNQLHALVVSAPELLRSRLLPLSTQELVNACSRLRLQPQADVELATYLEVLRRTARRALDLEAEASAYESQLTVLAKQLVPHLLAQDGVGPITASQLQVAWSHYGRFRSEAAFAALAGVAPIPASSGQQVRHRLNRGGDRQLNCALHTIALNRMTHHDETKAYVARRLQEGKSEREIRRCLKRYLARRMYRLMEGPGGQRYERSYELAA